MVCGSEPDAGWRGSMPGAWATDQAPTRAKKSSGGSWYFEYTSVCTRNRSSG